MYISQLDLSGNDIAVVGQHALRRQVMLQTLNLSYNHQLQAIQVRRQVMVTDTLKRRLACIKDGLVAKVRKYLS